MKTTRPGEAMTLPFDTAGWQATGPHHWRNTRGGELELMIVTAPPGFDLRDEPRFRDRMRQEILRRGGGLVSADLARSGESPVGRVVVKVPQKPQRPESRAYGTPPSSLRG